MEPGVCRSSAGPLGGTGGGRGLLPGCLALWTSVCRCLRLLASARVSQDPGPEDLHAPLMGLSLWFTRSLWPS